MRLRLQLATLALIALSLCSGTPADEARVAATLDAFHEAASVADGERYFELFTPDAIFLGTDGAERWTVDAFRAFAEGHFSEGRGWTYTLVERALFVDADGSTAWFDETLDNEAYGRVRGTGVLQRVGDDWKIAQYNLTIPVPNAYSREVARAARGEIVAPTTIWLLRHLEKRVEPGNRDPALTEQGSRRAEALRSLLATVPIDAIYTTPYIRTRKTIEPVALERSIEPVELAGGATDELVRRLSTEHAGQAVLVAGHSNTVPEIVAGLGVEEPLTMTEADYGDLFQITLDGRGGIRLLRLQLPDD